MQAGLASLERHDSPVADAVREEFTAHLAAAGDADGEEGSATRGVHGDVHREAVQAARQAVLAMRASDEIGDDAFHRMEEELDWLEMAAGRRES
jgi:CPA1 family monovalent cation:H+ antiporter